MCTSCTQLLLVTDAIVGVVNGVHRGYVSAPGVVRRHGTEWTMQRTIDEEVAGKCSFMGVRLFRIDDGQVDKDVSVGSSFCENGDECGWMPSLLP